MEQYTWEIIPECVKELVNVFFPNAKIDEYVHNEFVQLDNNHMFDVTFKDYGNEKYIAYEIFEYESGKHIAKQNGRFFYN